MLLSKATYKQEKVLKFKVRTINIIYIYTFKKIKKWQMHTTTFQN